MLRKSKKYGSLSDEQLMRMIQQGKTVAFNELYNRYSKRLLHFFYRNLGGYEEIAQDFLQEIFLKVIEKSKLFHPERNFSTWIFSLAYNLCKNEYRRKDVRKIVTNSENIDSITFEGNDYHCVEKEIDLSIFKNALFEKLKQLSIDHRTTFLLRFQQNYSIKEISKVLDCSEGTVKSRLFYSIKKLSTQLKDYNFLKTEDL